MAEFGGDWWSFVVSNKIVNIPNIRFASGSRMIQFQYLSINILEMKDQIYSIVTVQLKLNKMCPLPSDS